jgi:putative lipoic acid-binding regulatory protein
MKPHEENQIDELPKEVIDYIQQQSAIVVHGKIVIKKGTGGNYIDVEVTHNKRFPLKTMNKQVIVRINKHLTKDEKYVHK